MILHWRRNFGRDTSHETTFASMEYLVSHQISRIEYKLEIPQIGWDNLDTAERSRLAVFSPK